jgi:hypothetical protein
MPSLRRNSVAGFSLAETLVALAIAAFLVAALTRFVLGIRANALEVRQDAAIDILGRDLLERFSTSALQPGRIDGRSGAFAWRVNVAPLSYSARAQALGPDKPVAAAQPNGSSFEKVTMGQTEPKLPPKMVWNPYHLTVAVNSPSGRNFVIDTIRIVQQPERAQADETSPR